MTSAGAGSEPPILLKGALPPAGAPASRHQPASAPSPEQRGEGRTHKRGSGRVRDSGRRLLGEASLPCPAPPARAHPSIARPAPSPRCPRAPRAPRAHGREGGGGSGGKRGRALPHATERRGLRGSRGDNAGNQTRAGPALPAGARRSRSVPEKVGPPGRGRARDGARGGQRRPRPGTRGRSYRAAATRVRAPRAGGAGGLGEGRRSRGGGGPGAAARLGRGRRRKRGEASFLAAGGEKCSCPRAPAGGATSGAARGGAGLRRGGGPWRSPQTLSDARSPSRAQGRRRRRAAREPRGGGRGGSAGEDQETLALPSALAPAAVTPGLWGRMARARSLGIPGEAGAGRPASPGSGTGAGKAHPGEDGAGRPETSAPRGTEEQGCPEKVRDVDPHLGPGTAGVWGRDGPLGVRARGKETK